MTDSASAWFFLIRDEPDHLYLHMLSAGKIIDAGLVTALGVDRRDHRYRRFLLAHARAALKGQFSIFLWKKERPAGDWMLMLRR